MLSRVAENLYWMARYLERAENTARLINSVTQVLLDMPAGAQLGWDMLIRIVGLDDLFLMRYCEANEAQIVSFLIQDEENPSSIVSCLRYARENSRTFREVLPMEFWTRVNDLYLYMRGHASHITKGAGARYEILCQLIERRQAIVGLLGGSMSHDAAYQFIKLGHNLERADMTTRIVDVNSAVQLSGDLAMTAAAQQRLWMATLMALSAYQMYRRHVAVQVRRREVVHFLLQDPHFPRTIYHCLSEIENSLAALPNHQIPLKAVRRAWHRLEDMHLEEWDSALLHDYLDEVQHDLGAIHEALSRQYFLLHQTA